MPPQRRLLAGAALALFVGGFLYLWWTRGDLPAYVSMLRYGGASAPAIEGRLPVSGAFVSHSSTTITINEEGSIQTYPLEAYALAYAGLSETRKKITLEDLSAGTLVVLVFRAQEGGGIVEVHTLQ